MFNQCQFIGRLGADPEIKSFSNGGKVANLRLACTEKWKSKDGEKKERTEWVSIVIQSDGLVGIAERYLKKGSLVMLTGQLRTRKWQDQSGNDRYSTEVVVGMRGSIVMLDGKGGADNGGSGAQSGGNTGFGGGAKGGDGSRGHAAAGGFSDDLDDDIPFMSRDGVW